MNTRLLTHQQTKIAQLLIQGTPRDEIAKTLNIKPETVKKHLQRARRRAARKIKPVRMKRTRVRAFSLLQTENV